MADRLVVKGAREHNLTGVDIDLPRDSLVVFTGLSGSGKSSLAFDTHLRRGPAALRRVALGVRAPVPRADGQARRRLHRGPLAGGLDRPEVHEPQPALHRRHHHRGLRLPAPALRPRRHAALPDLRRGHLEADAAADRRPGARDGVGPPVPGARAGRPRPQGRVRRPVLPAPGSGVLPRPGRRHGVSALRPADAEEAGEARHRGGRRPALGQGERQAAPHRLGGDRAAAGRGRPRARLRGSRRERPGARAPVLREDGVPERPPARGGRPRAPRLLVQLALRCLPGLRRPRHEDGGRPRAPGPRRRALPRPRARSRRGTWGRPPSTSRGC